MNKQINIPYLLKIGPGKIIKIGKYLIDKDMKNIALFTGAGIDELLGKPLNSGLKKHKINVMHKEIVNDISIETITKTAFNLPSGINAIVGIGGGKALDFAKYAAQLLRLPFISVPTSTSNDGFCSPTSSLTVEGKRKTVKSEIPFGVVIDLDIIKGSPKAFFYSGIGDMVSKVSALWDWKEAFNKGFERYNDFASLLAYNSLDLLFLKHSNDITAPEFQRSLVTSLLMSGIAMEVAGTSRPASGSEHLISHALDRISNSPKIHGLQVGISTYLCALLQNNPNAKGVEDILSTTGFFDFAKSAPLDKTEYLEALKLAPEIKRNYYTILSEDDSFRKAVELVETNPILQQLIK